jgi:hypothetical protein
MTAARHETSRARRAIDPDGLARLSLVVPAGLAIIAEGAWITVLAGFVQEYVLAFPTLGLPTVTALVATGAVAARLVGRRLGDRWPRVAAGLAVAVGVAGWLLAAPEAPAALAGGDVARALGAHPGGWFAGLAIVRGFAYGSLPIPEARFERLLGVGIVGLTLMAMTGGMISEPWRGRFLSDTLTGTTVFAASAVLGLALARQASIGAESGLDVKRNPIWILLLVALVLAGAGLALPLSQVAAPVVTLAVGAAVAFALGPLALIALIAGFSRRTVWILAISLLIIAGLAAFFTLVGGSPGDSLGGGGAGARGAGEASPPAGVLVAAALAVIAGALVAVAVLVQAWMRRSPAEDGAVRETRTIDRGESSSAIPRLRRRRFGTAPPADAVAAYRALVAELDRSPELRRSPTETPQEHAHRLRMIGATGLSLDLLAADYALARFGDVTLSRREHRRAIGRWRSLRNDLAKSRG